MTKRSFVWLASAIVVVALALRIFYVIDARPQEPISGDINQYVLYAWNLNEGNTFSSALPNGLIEPDAYRGPGYPLILAIAMRVSGDARLVLLESQNGRQRLVADPPSWMALVSLFQAVCGALTVLLTIILGRYWLERSAALVSGLLVALWPHLITFVSTLLSETVFALVVVQGVWLLAAAERTRRWPLAACAGVVFGLAYLVNPIIALFPVLAAILLLRRGARVAAVVLLLVSSVAPLAWGVRNAALPASAGSALLRVEQNFVQGSWPSFLTAFGTRFDNGMSAQIVAAEAEEEQQFIASPAVGFAAMRERMAQAPAYFLRWYLLDKPFLLWDWSVRIGFGDIYFLRTEHSPFEHVPLLRALRSLYVFVNPILFVLSLCAALVVFLRETLHSTRMSFGVVAVASLFLYVTAVHVALQGEPRYAVAYRAIEVLLAVGAVTWSAGHLRRAMGALFGRLLRPI